jgi:hypothetical protein
MNWTEAQEWERNWHGLCCNSFHEEERQYVYARHMGLNEFATNWYGNKGWDFGALSVIDIGGGPASLLLKSKASRRVVVDPCAFPNWVKARYQECGIEFRNSKAEDLAPVPEYDLALVYNCLLHVEEPKRIIYRIRNSCRELRIFEWLDTPISDGHIHSFTAEQLDGWLYGQGKVITMKGEAGLVGKAYVGIFPC